MAAAIRTCVRRSPKAVDAHPAGRSSGPRPVRRPSGNVVERARSGGTARRWRPLRPDGRRAASTTPSPAILRGFRQLPAARERSPDEGGVVLSNDHVWNGDRSTRLLSSADAHDAGCGGTGELPMLAPGTVRNSAVQGGHPLPGAAVIFSCGREPARTDGRRSRTGPVGDPGVSPWCRRVTPGDPGARRRGRRAGFS